ncbi:hypothetical protein [Cryobacterium sp. Y62]|uniref:hypothetical protein n=1 Tax=Cryobacterium sp. Y62 TaxID=2048284 RepID=UPI001E32481D|nr:hypothetical protein [Cryobacterium sp. Y62]
MAVTAPPLPGEVSRTANVLTQKGKKLYDNIEVDISGDRARLFIPQTVSRNSTASIGAVWFYHAASSSHNALNGGFKYPGELVVDQNAIAICINAGGTQYTNSVATNAQKNAWTYLNALYTVRRNFLRATSFGGSLACYTYGKKLIPYIRGLYMVNGLYDNEWLYAYDTKNQAHVGDAYNNDLTLIKGTNPARISATPWKNSRVKVLVSDDAHPDNVVIPSRNGLALIKKIAPVAISAEVMYHTLAHDTPGFAHTDMIKTFAQWSI